jgi:hypothetical protein
VHKCLPLIDEATFRAQFEEDRRKLSPALLCCLYAQSLIYWRTMKQSDQHCPSLRYIWNQATEALYSELCLSPGIAVVIALLLNVSGRPVSSMMGNSVLLSSAIALAHSLGLNRDCRDWDIPEAEKDLRIRLWWAILIFDKW